MEMSLETLAARLASPAGNAEVLHEMVQGLIDLNLVLIDLLIQKQVVSDEEMEAALQAASQDFDDGMGAFIITGVLQYLQDGDTRLVRMAQAARILRAARRDRRRSPEKPEGDEGPDADPR